MSSTHANPLGTKTDAPFEVIWDIMRAWVKDHPVKAMVRGLVTLAVNHARRSHPAPAAHRQNCLSHHRATCRVMLIECECYAFLADID